MVMWSLHVVAVISLATALDRTFYWFCVRASGSSIALTRASSAGSAHEALTSLAGVSKRRDYLVRIAQAVGTHRPTMTNARMALREEWQGMNRHLKTLDLTIVIAPLLGILGTVLGIARAFGAGPAGGLPSPSALSAGIGLALNTTIWGLSITIIAAGARFLFRGFAARALVNIQNLLELIEDASESRATH